MSSNGDKNPLVMCLESLQNSVQQNRVSAELYKEVSKNLFLTSGESKLQVIHETCRHGCRSTKDSGVFTAQRESLDNDGSAIGNDFIDLTEESPDTKTRHDAHPNRQISTVEQLNALHDVQSRLRGYTIPQDGSRTRLEIKRAVYEALCIRENIPFTFNETIMYMGYRQKEVEIIPSPLKWQNLETNQFSNESLRWQCSFMLRYVQLNRESESWPWSLRQFAVYSRYDKASDSCIYAFVAPPAEILEDFRESLHGHDLDGAATDTGLKIKILRTTLAYWRSYAVWISNQLSQISTRIMFDDPLRNRLANSAYEGIGERLRNLEGMIDDGIFSLQANKTVVSSLGNMWHYCRNLDASSREAVCLGVLIDDLQTGFNAQISQLQNLQQKAKRCARTVSNNRDLASSIVLQENGQSLESLAIASKADNEATIELSKRAQEDTEAVKALTLVALVYLPISVVLSFFSTSLYESSESGFTLKPRWWLFLAIGVPLTVLTLVLWKGYVFLKKRVQNSQHSWYRLGRNCRKPKTNKSTGEKAV